MIVKPKIRGFVCITAHPKGCAQKVANEIAYARSETKCQHPKKVLVIGSSTGYGLSSRITAAFGSGAATLGVCFERPSMKGKPASAGWYNTAAFESAAHADGLYAKTINGDAFSNEIKEQTIRRIKEDLGQVDLVVYSLASPRRTDPVSGETFKSTLKPIGQTYTNKSLDTDKELVTEVTLEPADQEEIDATVKVMGGEDWKLWMDALADAGVLAEGAKTVAYSYIGPELTWPIYKDGTIGNAKKDLESTAETINQNGSCQAYVAVNKAVVTQASSAIPVVPLYNSVLFKVMKAAGTHEDCIEQIVRLFNEYLFEAKPQLDNQSRIRIDDLEMRADTQSEVAAVWPNVTTENLRDLTDFDGYQTGFLNLFGFGIDGVDYDEDVTVEVPIPSIES